MILLHNRQVPSPSSATYPFRSLTLRRWAAAGPVQSRVAPAPESDRSQQTRWTCARCGEVSHSLKEATEHINLHSLQPPSTDDPAAATPA